MRKAFVMVMAASLLAATLGGCATSNQKAAESSAETTAAQTKTDETAAEEAAESPESEAAKEMEEASAEGAEYAVKPRQIDRKSVV